jgi:hypothetical protein
MSARNRNRKARQREARQAASDAITSLATGPRMLAYAEPQLRPATLVLIESTGETVCSITALRSFARVEHDGRWFRLNGQDRMTGEMMYLPEVIKEAS